MTLHERATAGPAADCGDFFLSDEALSARRVGMAEEQMCRAESKKKQLGRVRAEYFEKKSHGVEIKRSRTK
jgi:hypothetical protein